MSDRRPTREVKAYLATLKEATTAACDAAYDASPRVDGAINWGDLFCYEAALIVDDEGFTGYRVTIQEADPDNREFCEWIRDYLKERGYDVTVVTEW